MNFSFYTKVTDKVKKYDIDLASYISRIKDGGDHEDAVHNARAEKQKGNIEQYKKIKSNASAITGSCLIRAGEEGHALKNVDKLNGLMLLDIDKADQINEIDWNIVKNDTYVHLLHKSFSGEGYVIFVKTNCKKVETFKYYYNSLSDYFFKTYGIVSDPACKNPNRLRYISYDPDIYPQKR